ncbi:hypothetical protein T4C_6656 [Trichinella pseudospiralis]|uniref:Uncharacterized protein n=1 Tax=Trichinella pseudospiralis TaxID=6337 RepID=A0A0V1IUV7_TRIPS|nr:hypothetical protein T4C_4275 [Trichinella pseudospiralis]KRZ26505.1 hypothetical protein T4C_6656 [Trichinella pseudospiralis]
MHLCDGTSKAGSSKEIPSNCKTLVTVRREKCILTHLRVNNLNSRSSIFYNQQPSMAHHCDDCSGVQLSGVFPYFLLVAKST